jgi:RimJ/RimL family protein N-acetyltransferase
VVSIFQPITEELLNIALSIINSNPQYNILENGNPTRILNDIKNEFLNQNTESYLILLDNQYVGIIDFLSNNPNDNCPWIGLLMIHGKFHSQGYGKLVYTLFEERLKQQGYTKVRIGVMEENKAAKRFWIAMGFRFYAKKHWENKVIECYEKCF